MQRPQNGLVFYSGTTFGLLVTYSCSVGYQLIGVSERTCLASGQWSDAAPACTRESLVVWGVSCGNMYPLAWSWGQWSQKGFMLTLSTAWVQDATELTHLPQLTPHTTVDLVNPLEYKMKYLLLIHLCQWTRLQSNNNFCGSDNVYFGGCGGPFIHSLRPHL